jgi:hypothetical protein
MFIVFPEGAVSRPAQQCDNEPLPEDFPQANTRLSKANLVFLFFCVNSRRSVFALLLSSRVDER